MTRHLIAAFALLSSACASNMLGREIRVERGTYEAGGGTHPFWSGTPAVANADRLPVLIFLEGDGSMCQAYSEGLWTRFITRYTGDYVLVRPVTTVNEACDTDEFRRADFFHRVDELAAIVRAVSSAHPSQPIFLVGHSAGAHVALLYANRSDAAVRGIVNLAGGLDALAQVIPAIERERARRDGSSGDEVRVRLAEFDEVAQRVRANASSTEPFWGRTYRFWNQMFYSGVGELWRATRLPVLVVHGEEDLDSVPYASVRAASEELAEHSNVEFVFLPGRGHDVLSRDVFLRINEWVRAMSGTQPSRPPVRP